MNHGEHRGHGEIQSSFQWIFLGFAQSSQWLKIWPITKRTDIKHILINLMQQHKT